MSSRLRFVSFVSRLAKTTLVCAGHRDFVCPLFTPEPFFQLYDGRKILKKPLRHRHRCHLPSIGCRNSVYMPPYSLTAAASRSRSPDLLGAQASEVALVHLRGTMENRKTHPVNEFKVVDGHGKEYIVFEYQEGTETQSLKWIKAGPTWYCLSDGTAVDKIDDNTFKISMIDGVLHRQP